jgi:hypothetical protein
MTRRAEELSAEIFTPVISGTIDQAAAYPDAVLAGIAEFLAARRELLDRYLAAAPKAEGPALVTKFATPAPQHPADPMRHARSARAARLDAPPCPARWILLHPSRRPLPDSRRRCRARAAASAFAGVAAVVQS